MRYFIMNSTGERWIEVTVKPVSKRRTIMLYDSSNKYLGLGFY